MTSLRMSLAVLIAAFAAGCSSSSSGGSSSTGGAIHLVVASELSTPTPIDALEIQVEVAGTTPFFQTYSVPADASLPGSLTLSAGATGALAGTIAPGVAPIGGSGAAKITVTGLRAGVARVSRTASFSLPVADERTLLLTLTYSCLDFAACGAGSTCQQGECRPDAIELSALPRTTTAFDPKACFDTKTCFASAATIDLSTLAGCDVPLMPATANLGASWSLDPVPGHLVPLDEGDAYTSSGTSATLSPGLCAAVKSGKVTVLAASTACAKKSPTTPVCP